MTLWLEFSAPVFRCIDVPDDPTMAQDDFYELLSHFRVLGRLSCSTSRSIPVDRISSSVLQQLKKPGTAGLLPKLILFVPLPPRLYVSQNDL
jgi:hypothetical protein